MMNRITLHHTGGGYTPSAEDLEAYHLVIDGEGRVVEGKHQILDNAPGRTLQRGTYAAHTWKLNTGNIGVSVCSMAGAQWGDPFGSTKCFPRAVQIETLIKLTAQLCVDYGITPSRENTLSHAEVEPTLHVKQKQKWDFDYQIFKMGGRDPIAIGDELRQEVTKAIGSQHVPLRLSPLPTLKQGDQGDNVLLLQTILRLDVRDGQFGPKTRAAVVAFQKKNHLLPDGVVGLMTWAALGS